MRKNIVLRGRLRSNIRPMPVKRWLETDGVETGSFCYLASPEWFNMKSKSRRNK